jgi:hypothetical protein
MAAGLFSNHNPPAEKQVPTPEQLANHFAALAIKAALTPEPDGLNVLDELSRIFPKPTR